MAQVIPFNEERRFVLEVLEEELACAKRGEISSLCVVYVKPDGRIGHHTYASKATGLVLGTAFLAAQNDYVTQWIGNTIVVAYGGDADNDKEPA